MVILGSLSALVFGLLGVRYFYALAIFAGVANFVPILGPIATVIVAGALGNTNVRLRHRARGARLAAALPGFYLP